jgi:hypothetical protein
MSKATPTKKKLPPLILDTRPIFEHGATPCQAIDASIAALKPNQNFILLASFEPAPLLAKLKGEGFSHQTRQLPDGTWQVEFSRENQ